MILKTVKWVLMVLGLLTLLGFISSLGVISTAHADEMANETEVEVDDEEEEFEFVFSDSLKLIDSEWDGDTWVATFEADIHSDVTVTDAGRTSDNNENVVVDRETFSIASEGTTEVRFSVEESRQVTIDDGHTLLLKGHDDSIYVLPTGDWTAVGIIVASVLAFISIIANVMWIRQIRKNKVDRVV